MLLHEPFNSHALGRGDACFARCEGDSLTYAEAKTRAERMSSALLSAGLLRGDRFCLLMRNSIDLVLFIYAAAQSGLVAVPLNYRLAPREWATIMADAGARAVVADPEYASALDDVLKADGKVPAPIRICMTDPASDWLALDALLLAAPDRASPGEPGPEDPILQLYTSGTTGRAKGVVLSHRNVMSAIISMGMSMPHKLSVGERSLVVMPLFHVAALSTALMAACNGACLVIHRDVIPAAIARSLIEDEIVFVALVPAVIQFILEGVPGLTEMTFPHLKLLGYGASAIAEPVLRRAMDVFQCGLSQGFGMTELAGGCTLLTEADHRRALAGRPELLLSAGRVTPGNRIRVVGPDDADVPCGVMGELVVAGDQVMSGYWNMPEATAEALRGGWLHTGDAGYLDAEGYLFIVDRMKDMIISGGENVYPAEVEAVLHEHPDVADVAVIGVPDERWGETVMAVVVRAAGSDLSDQQMDVFCRARLGGYKVPRRYVFVEALPRNPTGKVLKRELREAYWPAQGRRVN